MTTVAEFDRLYELAKRRRSAVDSVLQECWKYVLPMYERRHPHMVTADQASDFQDLYDATAPSAAQDLASEVLDQVWPADGEPFTLQLGPDMRIDASLRKRIDGHLAERAEAITAAINGSGLAEGQDWYSATHEALLDWTISQGFLAAHPSTTGLCDVWFEHMPLPTVLPLRTNGKTSHVFRCSRLTRRDILQRWPGARLKTQWGNGQDLEAEHDVTEGIIRDWSETGVEAWTTCVKVEGIGGTFVHEARETGAGSKPFIDFAFMIANGDTLGRGPAMLALPHIRVINAVVQMHLDNLDMTLQGIWGMESGSLNTETIEIKPGLVVPYEQGTKGLVRLDAPRNDGSFRDAVIGIQAAIRDVMYGFDLGPVDRTPRSATEVMARQSVGTKRKSGPHHRLLSGLITQTVQFADWALSRSGKIEPLMMGEGPASIDGRRIVVKPASPLSRSQKLDKVIRFDRFLELLMSRFGPAAVPAATQISMAAPMLAEWIGVDPRLVRPTQQLEAFEKLLVNAAAGQAAPQAAPMGAAA